MRSRYILSFTGKLRHVTAMQQDEHWREIQKPYAGLGVLEGLCNRTKTELSSLLGIKSEDDVPKSENCVACGRRKVRSHNA